MKTIVDVCLVISFFVTAVSPEQTRFTDMKDVISTCGRLQKQKISFNDASEFMERTIDEMREMAEATVVRPFFLCENRPSSCFTIIIVS